MTSSPGFDSAIVIGLMSGTSLDGISAAVVQFDGDVRTGDLEATLRGFAHRPYHATERERLEQAMQGGTAREYCRLHVDLGHWLADAALGALHDVDVPRAAITCVASHGQTLWHEPGHSTWQLGDTATIAERLGCPVIGDFRSRDVAAGGQGAPLVPMADAMLFAHASAWRALQNIGGIGNVTVVPPRSAGTMAQRLDGVRAFDTGPGVVLVDAVTRRLRPELPFDRDGQLARAGRVIDTVVDAALALPYFREMPPKSTGRELFTPAYADDFIAACRRHGAADEDVVATAVAFTARSIADQYARFLPEPIADVLLSGGGAENPAIVDSVREAFRSHDGARGTVSPVVRRFDECFFDGEAKEAVAFALLGLLTHAGVAGNVPRATGARGARILGTLVRA